MVEVPTPMTIQAPIRLCLLAANQRMRNTLSLLFSGSARGRLILVEESGADIALLDLDTVGAEAEWQAYRERSPDKPLLLLSVAPRETTDRCIWVRKPFTIQELMEAVALASEFLQPPEETAAIPHEQTQPVRDDGLAHVELPVSAPPPKAPTAREADFEGLDLTDPQVVARISYDAKNHLPTWLERLAEHVRQHGSAQLQIDQHPCIDLDTEGFCRVWLNEAALRTVCTAALSAERINIADFSARVDAADSTSAAHLSLEALRWRLALWTYQGRLPRGASLHERICLPHWPNLTRLDETPNAMRIAALLVAHPMSLERLAEALDIPRRDVFAFYAAASAIGLVKVAKRATDHLLKADPPPSHPQRGFLRRLIQRLGTLVGK